MSPVTAGALPAVYRACSLIADALASVELRVVQVESDGGRKPVVDTDASRALADWSYDDKEMFVYHAALGGNGLCILRKNSRGGVLALESVSACRIEASLDEANELFYGVRNEYSVSAGTREIVPASNMIHLKYRAIGDRYGCSVFGVAPIVTAAEQVGLILASRSFQAAIWKAGATPIGVLKTPNTLKQPVIDRLRAQWDEFRGTGKVAILEAGLEFQTIKPGMTSADSDLVAYGRFGVEEVARLYGCPPSVLAQTGSASYSTSTEEFRALVLYCLRPWAARFCDTLSRALLTRDQRLKGMRVEAPLDHLLIAPGKETSEYAREMLNAGVISVNEARNMFLGLPDITGGEVHRVPSNMAALTNLPKLGLGNSNKPKPEEEQ